MKPAKIYIHQLDSEKKMVGQSMAAYGRVSGTEAVQVLPGDVLLALSASSDVLLGKRASQRPCKGWSSTCAKDPFGMFAGPRFSDFTD